MGPPSSDWGLGLPGPYPGPALTITSCSHLCLFCSFLGLMGYGHGSCVLIPRHTHSGLQQSP